MEFRISNSFTESLTKLNNEEQKAAAEKSREKMDKSGVFKQPIVTEIIPLKKFYMAEEYHQDYYKKNPRRYKMYRSGSGRDQFIESTWEKMPPKTTSSEKRATSLG